MTDRIALLGLKARGHHGVLPEERRDGQLFVADVVLHVDAATAAASDDLADTVDYGAVAAEVVAVLAGPPSNLIETVAQHVAEACLRHDRVTRVEVVLHKPDAPIDVPFDDVQLCLERVR